MDASRDQPAVVGIGRIAFTKHLGRWRAREVRWARGESTLILEPRRLLGSPWHT